MLKNEYKNGHSLISPSGAARWTQCPASVRFSLLYEEERSENTMAQRGTDIHQLGEHILKGESFTVGQNVKRDTGTGSFQIGQEMLREAQAYADYVRAIAEKCGGDIYPEVQVTCIEEHDIKGHIDACVPCPDGTLHIIDLKTGRGQIDATNNLQLQLYAIGALDEFGMIDDFDKVVLHIVQDNVMAGANTNSWEVSVDDLEEFRTWIAQRAYEALQEDSECRPSESACKWCPHAGACEALIEETKRTLAFVDLDETAEELPLERITAHLAKKPLLDIAFAAFEDRIAQSIRDGKSVPGFKLVRKNARKKWVDEIEAYEKLKRWAPLDDIAPRKLITPTQAQKVLGQLSTRKKNVFDKLWKQPEGDLKLVPESAKGQAVTFDAFESLD
jgi:hypothetical protein